VIRIVVLVGLAALIVPMVVTQLMQPERRRFESVELQDTAHTEVVFRNDAQGIDLAALLFVPAGDGPFAGAVVIHGSGTSHRRNGWYLRMVDYLQRHGVVVLVPDKRGSEKSSGDWRRASFSDLATDTEAALEYLTRKAEVPVSKAGIIGMSQGGHIAPIVASRRDDVAFVVNVSGGAIPMHEQLVYEERNNLEEMGVLPGVSHLIAYPSAWSIRELRQREFWQAVGNFDPLPYWRRVAVGALILYGADDANVPILKSAARLRSLGRKNLRVEIYEGSGHALETPSTENASIFREDALQDMLDFILAPVRDV
jgi:dienelactone hydrolase